MAKPKKKMTKKELKALNHAKLMGKKEHSFIQENKGTSLPDNVVPLHPHLHNKDKAA